MRNPAGRTSFLLLLGGVLGVWPLLQANSIDVDLELPFCHNDTQKSMVCNYTDATEEVILNAYPTGCNKWKTLKLIGAKSLSVTVSCFGQIIVSSSNELSVTVHTREDENNPTRSLHILDSNVLSLEGAVGRLYITRSNVASLNVSYVTDLNIVDSSVDSFDSVLNTDHDCLLSNTSIKSLDRLQVSGGKHLNIIGCHIDVLNKMVYSVHAISEMEGGAIHRIVKGGVVVRDGPLVLSNVSIGSLEKEAIVATDDGKLHFMYCSINEAVVDSVFLRNGGSVSLMKTSVTGEQLDFHLKGEAEVYPFSLFEQFRGFATVSMVWSDFFGALMVLLVTFRVFLILMRRKGRRGPCEFSFPGKKTDLISKSSSDGDDTKDTPQGNPPPFAHDVKPDIPTFRTAHEQRRLRRRRPSPTLQPANLPPSPPQPNLPPLGLGTPQKPPNSLTPYFLPKNVMKNPFLPPMTQKDDLAKGTCLMTCRGPFSFKTLGLEPESSTKVQGSFLHGLDKDIQKKYEMDKRNAMMSTGPIAASMLMDKGSSLNVCYTELPDWCF